MKANIIDTSYGKCDRDTQKLLDKGIEKLNARLTEYAQDGKNISCIFNDDILVHKIIHKTFFVYKTCVNKLQFRILYTIVDEELIIVSHYCKNKTHKKSSIEYVTIFEKICENVRL